MSNNADIEALPTLREVITTSDLWATKSLGQNFLLDLNLTRSIARAGGDLSNIDVIEIGPGPGGLTRAILLEGARHLDAIEFDPRAVAALSSLINAANNRLVVHQADALNTDIMQYGTDGHRAIIANLPYNIATPLLIGFLRNAARINFMLLMFQHEVAARICAPMGDKAYGRLSVMCQYLCRTKIVKTLPPTAFLPAPKVKSSVVHFIPHNTADLPRFETMESLVGLAFSQRRKMIRATLKPYLHHLEKLGIAPTLRAEDITVAEYIALAKSIEESAENKNKEAQ